LPMKVLYRPVLLVNHEATDFYRCLPVRLKNGVETARGKKALRYNNEIIETAEKNARVLSLAFADLTRAHAAGKKVRLIVPINSYAIASGDAATLIVKAIRELDEALRAAVIVEVYEFPKSLTLDMLADMTIPFLPFFDKFLAEPRPEMTDFTMFANSNYFGVSLNLGGRVEKGEDAVAVMTKFWAEATNRRLKVVVQGITEQDVADKATQYEAFALDGSLLGADMESMTDDA